MVSEPDAFSPPSARTVLRTVSLANPWMQNLYRWYQAKQKHSPPLMTLAEQELASGQAALADLWSDRMKAHLADHPEDRSTMAQRERDIVAQMQENQAILTQHYAALNDMKRQLIRSGFLDEQGQSLYE